VPAKLSNEVLLAAIQGFQSQKKHIDTQIAELRQLQNGNRAELAAAPQVRAHKRRKFSAAARRRMREAQQRRWAAVRGETQPSKPAAGKAPARKRRLSAAGRKAIIAATKKRWALKRAEKVKK
jgi:hypothetical protein